MLERTRALLDNTTFAAAGRAIYAGDFSCSGGMNADIYYRRFPDAKSEDIRSLAELLTALIIFDELLWEASSFDLQETREQNQEYQHDVWLYDWYPLFAQIHSAGIIMDHHAAYSPYVFDAAQGRAVEWVAARVHTKRFELPENFRLPLAYLDKDHFDRERIERHLEYRGYLLSHREISLALFLARGLFYQAVALQQQEWSYLPHSFRSILMRDLDHQASALLCAGVTSWDAAAVVGALDATFMRRLKTTLKTPEAVYRGVAIGASLMQRTRSRREAIDSALAFRETSHGEEIRQTFRELVASAAKGDVPTVQRRLAAVDRTLRNMLMERFGYVADANDSSSEVTIFFGLLGGIGTLVEAAVQLLPTELRASINRVLYKSITGQNGFQVLFGYYFAST